MPVFLVTDWQKVFGRGRLEESRQEYSDMFSASNYSLISIDLCWGILACNLFPFIQKKMVNKRDRISFKKWVGQHNHLPTWFNLKTEFEEAFPNVGDLFSPLWWYLNAEPFWLQIQKMALVSGMGKQEMSTEIYQ